MRLNGLMNVVCLALENKLYFPPVNLWSLPKQTQDYRMKPRLTKYHGYWICVGNKKSGLGTTPKAAYFNWVNELLYTRR